MNLITGDLCWGWVKPGVECEGEGVLLAWGVGVRLGE